MWYVPSTAVPFSFVFLCACSAESYPAAPAIVRLGKKKEYFLDVETVKILDCRRHEVHSEAMEGVGSQRNRKENQDMPITD